MRNVKWLMLLLVLLITAGFLVTSLFEQQIARTYLKIFPTQIDKSIPYWLDLTDILLQEFVFVCLFLLASLYAAAYLAPLTTLDRLTDRLIRSKQLFFVIGFAGLVLLILIAAIPVLELFPNSADEYAYLFQAEAMSRGTLWDDAHDLPDFFEFNHIAQVNDKWVGRFPPGWPLLLAAAYAANVPVWLVNPVLGILSIIVFYHFCRRFYNERIALWATLATAFTACFIFNAASFFSHTSSFLEVLLFLYFLYRYVDDRKIYQALLAGFFLGLLAITRYYTAALIFISVVPYLFHVMRWHSVRTLFCLGIGGAGPLAFLLWYNYSITGNALLPVTMWAYNDEALGFVNGHTPAKGIEHIGRRIMMFIAWVSPAFLFLYVVFLWQKIREKSRRWVHPEDYWLVLLMFGYMLYYHHGGNQYGPRFYFEAIPFLIVFVVARVFEMRHRLASSMLVCGIIYAIAKIPVIANREHQVIEERKDLYAQVETKGIRNAVIFLASGTGVIRPIAREDLTRNDKNYRNGVIYAMDRKERNIELMQFYKTKEFYLYKRKMGAVSGELIKIDSAKLEQLSQSD